MCARLCLFYVSTDNDDEGSDDDDVGREGDGQLELF